MPHVVHVYLKNCKTNPQPPGLADFLRGTIAIYNYAKKYNFKFYVDYDSNPLFKYLTYNGNYISDYEDRMVYELIPSQHFPTYDMIDAALEELFRRKKSFSVVTNSFYTKGLAGLENFGPLTEDCRQFMRSLLIPKAELKSAIETVYSTIGLDRAAGYDVIHLRFGDRFLNGGAFDGGALAVTAVKIRALMAANPGRQYLMLTDSGPMGSALKKEIPNLFYWENKKIHLGDLRNDLAGVKDTLVDFFLMSGGELLYSRSSGFGIICSLLYGCRIMEL
jgi:hypothetical protein